MTDKGTSGQSVQKSPELPEGLFLMDGIEGLRSLPRHSVDMLLTDPPYGTTRNFWDVPLPLPELWEAVKWAVKPDGAVLFFAQCPYDKVLGASNLSMLRYEWVWYKSRCTGFLNARRAPLKKTENILVFYQKLPLYNPQFEQGKPYKKIAGNNGNSTNYGKFTRSGSGSEDGLRFPGNVLTFPAVQRTVHPTQKPVALCEYFIKTYTRPGEVVADICAGSATTAVAALNTGRRFICFETVPAYYAAATERIRLARAALEAGEKGVYFPKTMLLIMADVEMVERRIDKAQKAAKGDKKYLREVEVFTALKDWLNDGNSARSFECDEDDAAIIATAELLSLKPIIYAANLDEDGFADCHSNAYYQIVEDLAAKEGAQVIPVCAKLEAEIAELDADEKKMFLDDLGIAESGLDRLIKASYALLGLISFLTSGEDECRAWTIKKGTKAPQAAGKIHTDFERGFIRAEVVNFDDLMACGSMNGAKEKGLVRSEGKEYVMKDGDIVLFRFNV